MVRFKIHLVEYITALYSVLFFVTPLLMYDKTSEIFEFNKMMFIYLTTIVIVFLYLLQLIFSHHRFQKNTYYLFLLGFVAIHIISTLFSIDRQTSFFGYYGRWNGGLLSLLAYVSLFFILVQTSTANQIGRLLKVSLFSSFVVILWGITGLLGFDFSCRLFTGQFTNACWSHDFNPAVRMFSTIGQPNWLGAYLSFHLFIGLYFLFKYLPRFPRKKDMKELMSRKRSILYGSYVVLNSVALYFTKSRSTWLAVIVMLGLGVLLFFPYVWKFSKKRKQLIYGAFIILIVGIGITLFSSGYLKRLVSLPHEATQITDSFDIRKVVWKGAIELGNRYPLKGSGVETFAYSYYFTRPQEHNLTSEWDYIYNKAHNEFLNYLATTGYVGLLSYLSLIGGTVYLAVVALKQIDDAEEVDSSQHLRIIFLLLAYGTIQITNFFGFSISIMQLLFYLVPAIYIILIQKKDQSYLRVSNDQFTAFPLQQKLAVYLLFICFALGVFNIFRYYQADISYAKGRAELESDQNELAIRDLQKALAYKYEHVYEDKLSSAYANYAYDQSLQGNNGYARSLILLSQNANEHALMQAPFNILYLRTKGKNYYMYYQINKDSNDLFTAVRAMEDVTKIAPTDVQSRYSLAIFYWIVSQESTDKKLQQNYLDKTKTTLRDVLQMKPNYVEAQELLKSI